MLIHTVAENTQNPFVADLSIIFKLVDISKFDVSNLVITEVDISKHGISRNIHLLNDTWCRFGMALFAKEFQDGKQYRSLNCYCSAISSAHLPIIIDGSSGKVPTCL